LEKRARLDKSGRPDLSNRTAGCEHERFFHNDKTVTGRELFGSITTIL